MSIYSTSATIAMVILTSLPLFSQEKTPANQNDTPKISHKENVEKSQTNVKSNPSKSDLTPEEYARYFPLGFVEKWVLNPDRKDTLKQLVPGTQSYFFFHALHYQQTGQKKLFTQVMNDWEMASANKKTSTVKLNKQYHILKNRQLILDYPNKPEESIKKLSHLFNLKTDYQEPVSPKDAKIPHVLDQKKISVDAFTKVIASKDKKYTSFTDEQLIRELRRYQTFDRQKRRWFLSHINRFDFPALPQLVLAELQDESHPLFHQIPGTQHLLLHHLVWLEKKFPALRNQESFVSAYLQRLQPGNEAFLEMHPNEKRAWLEKSWLYTQTLPEKYNALKGRILYHLLEDHLEHDSYPKDLFLAYCKIYAQSQKGEGSLLLAFQSSDILNKKFKNLIALRPIYEGDHKKLLLSYLHHLLGKNKSIVPFKKFFLAKELAEIQAESQLLVGSPPEKWSGQLSPEVWTKLRDRTEVSLAKSNVKYWKSGDSVELLLDLKNTPELTVRLFQIDVISYIREHAENPTLAIKLDGLVPQLEKNILFNESPFVKHRYHLKLPELKGRGIWIVECISRGVSCRALVRKGGYQIATRPVPSGQEITVFDENLAPAYPATISLQSKGHFTDYFTDKQGKVLLPRTTSKQNNFAIVSSPVEHFGKVIYIKRLTHQYKLELLAGTDREQLIAGKSATLLIYPRLLNNNVEIPLSQLKNARISISATLHDGVTTRLSDIPLPLNQQGPIKQKISVPDGLRALDISIDAQIFRDGGRRPVSLVANKEITLNTFCDTSLIAQPLVSFTKSGWNIELLGRNGEALAQHTLPIQFFRRGFNNPVKLTLSTDSDGWIHLGELRDISRVDVLRTDFSNAQRFFPTTTDFSYYDDLHILSREEIRLPCRPGITMENLREHFSLIRYRNGTSIPVDSMTSHLRIENGEIIISDLTKGEYKLFTNTEESKKQAISIFVTDGKKYGEWLISDDSIAEAFNPVPIRLAYEMTQQSSPKKNQREKGSASNEPNKMTLHLSGDMKDANVLLVGGRYYKNLDAINLVDFSLDRNPRLLRNRWLENQWSNGRKLSDELQYILTRRKAKHYVGNLLERPSLLLNPSLQEKSYSGLTGDSGGAGFGFIPQCMRKREGHTRFDKNNHELKDPFASANFDFLAHSSVLEPNLIPDKKGNLVIDLTKYSHCQSLVVVAYNKRQTYALTIPLKRNHLFSRDLRLARSLSSKKHYVGMQTSKVLKKGESEKIQHLLDADWRIYSSLHNAFDFLASQSSSGEVQDFRDLMFWPMLPEAQREALAQQLASHEFNLFLYYKDRPWFNAHIRPMLKNKRHLTFIDRFLLDQDLSFYFDPVQYQRLNPAEKALLARKSPTMRDAIVQDLKDRYEVVKPTPEKRSAIFRAALKQNSLALEDRLGISPSDLIALESSKNKIYSTLILQQKLESIIIPLVDFKKESLIDAIDFLSLKSAELEQGRDAISFVLDKRSNIDQRMIHELHLKNASLKTVLQEICDKANVSYRIYNGSIQFMDRKVLDESKADSSHQDKVLDKDASFKRNATKEKVFTQTIYETMGGNRFTQVWGESNYYNRNNLTGGPTINENQFWIDFASHASETPFLSPSFIECSDSCSAMMMALSVMDLPFHGKKPQVKVDHLTLDITSRSPMILFYRDMREVNKTAHSSSLLLRKNFFLLGDRTRVDSRGITVENPVQNTFLAGVPYLASLVITNPTITPQHLQVLYQIPRGAIPLQGNRSTRVVDLTLKPHATSYVEYSFYFPSPGIFPHFPEHVIEKNEVQAVAKNGLLGSNASIKVVSQVKPKDQKSWLSVARFGSNAEVLNRLHEVNLQRVSLQPILWRLSEKSFFHQVVSLLNKRLHYDPYVFAYGFKHNDTKAMETYIAHLPVSQFFGENFDAPLVHVDALRQNLWQHLEFSPLLNTRRHPFKGKYQITNELLENQYASLLNTLLWKTHITQDDQLSLIYYLFLQDRIEEAIARFQSLKKEEITARMQYDYLHCYVLFYQEKPAEAARIASKWKNAPSLLWRKRFGDVIAQNREIAEVAQKKSTPTVHPKSNLTPQLRVLPIDNGLQINYADIDEVSIKLYKIDLEVMFSNTPFYTDNTSIQPSILPNKSLKVHLPKGKKQMLVKLPQDMQYGNILAVMDAASIHQVLVLNSSALFVSRDLSSRTLTVTQSKNNRVLPRCYVKIYVELDDGEVVFFKDGYTDLRGKFPYETHPTIKPQHIKRYSILTSHPQYGSKITLFR